MAIMSPQTWLLMCRRFAPHRQVGNMFSPTSRFMYSSDARTTNVHTLAVLQVGMPPNPHLNLQDSLDQWQHQNQYLRVYR